MPAEQEQDRGIGDSKLEPVFEDWREWKDKVLPVFWHPKGYQELQADPRIPTMDKPLIIESAFPGTQEGRQNPWIPNEPDKIAAEIIDSVKAGAAVIHVHPRDPETGGMRIDPLLVKEIVDPVFDAVGDVVTNTHCWFGDPTRKWAGIDYRPHAVKFMEIGNGTKYLQASVVLITCNPRDGWFAFGAKHSVNQGVPFLEELGVRPVFELYDTFSIKIMKEELVDTGLAKSKPYICRIHMGKHTSTPNTFGDPESTLQLISSLMQLRKAIPEALFCACIGGRNWLPLTVQAITLGADLVRVGQEDQGWMYPHIDEYIKKNSDAITKVATIARELGRPIATPDQARQILNIKKPKGVTRSFVGFSFA